MSANIFTMSFFEKSVTYTTNSTFLDFISDNLSDMTIEDLEIYLNNITPQAHCEDILDSFYVNHSTPFDINTCPICYYRGLYFYMQTLFCLSKYQVMFL